MKIVAFSDSHGHHHDIDIPDGDLLICAGDYCFRGSRKEIDEFAEWMGGLPHKNKIAISGNHDFGAQKYENYARESFLRNDVIYLEDTNVDIGRLLIHGSPWTPSFGPWAFMKDDEALFDDHWKKIPDDVNILITHGPPYAVRDYTPAWQENAGSATLMGSVMSLLGKRQNPLIHIFGHIHEGYGRLVDGNYWAFNVSVCTLLYDPVNPVTVIEV